jgi:hypothetical protein
MTSLLSLSRSLMDADEPRAGVDQIKLDIPAVLFQDMNRNALNHVVCGYLMMLATAISYQAADELGGYMTHRQQVLYVDAFSRFVLKSSSK